MTGTPIEPTAVYPRGAAVGPATPAAPPTLARTIRRAAWRYRRQLAPFAALAALTITHAVLADRWAWAFLAALAITVTAVSIAASGTGSDVWVVLVGITTALWLIVTTITGDLYPRATIALWATFSIPWWVHHQRRTPSASPAGKRTGRIAELAALWETEIAVKDGPLPRSTIHDIVPLPAVPDALEARVRFTKTTINGVVERSGMIEVALELPHASVSVNRHPSGKANEARVLIIPRNPLRELVPWTGPTYDPAEGTYRLGTRVDWSPGLFVLHDEMIGARPGLFVGVQGSGKSGTVCGHLAELHHAPDVVPWLIDGAGGGSQPEWVDAVDWFAGDIAAARVMLRAWVKIGDARKRSLKRAKDANGKSTHLWRVTPRTPHLRLVIEEAPVILADDECADLVAQSLKRHRAANMGIDLVLQLANVNQFNDPDVRALASSSNRVLHRTSDRLSASQVSAGQMQVDSSAIPERFPDGTRAVGLLYLQSPAMPDVLLTRARWSTDWDAIAAEPAGCRLDDFSRAAAGDLYRAAAAPTPATPEAAPAELPAAPDNGGTRPKRLLAALADAGRPLKWGEWARAAGVPPGSGVDARRELLAAGAVVKVEGRNPQDTTYKLPEKG